MNKSVCLALALMFVAACAGPSSRAPSAPAPDPGSGSVPTQEGAYKVGEPYHINGTRYVPREDPRYDETGIASWYGPQFHGRNTANGERFDRYKVSAAHNTLPMPVHARVTNLENGKSIVVRINDRGPFARSRIIDMSEKGAELLGFKAQGTAKVRVEYLGPAPLNPAQDSTHVAKAKPADLVAQVPVSPSNIYIQAGAFSLYDNAERLKNRISPLGPTWITTVDVGGTTFNRVRLGPISTVEQADDLLNRLLAMGVDDARILVDEWEPY